MGFRKGHARAEARGGVGSRAGRAGGRAGLPGVPPCLAYADRGRTPGAWNVRAVLQRRVGGLAFALSFRREAFASMGEV